jgi:hypothetical protein
MPEARSLCRSISATIFRYARCSDESAGVAAVVVVGIWVIKIVHDAVLVAESDLGPQENVGQRLSFSGLCPDFCLEFARLLLKPFKERLMEPFAFSRPQVSA